MYGMPHAWLLWWQALLWGHYTTHSCHWGSSHMGLTRSWCKTLVTRKLGLHLFLLAGTMHRTNIQTKETLLCPFTVQKMMRNLYQCWRALISDWGCSSSESSFNITTKEELLSSIKDVQPKCLASNIFWIYSWIMIKIYRIKLVVKYCTSLLLSIAQCAIINMYQSLLTVKRAK